MKRKSVIRIQNLAPRNLNLLLSQVRERTAPPTKVESQVKRIIRAVATRGDRALIEFTKRFDGVVLTRADLRVKAHEIKSAYKKVSGDLLESLKWAKSNIEDGEGRWLRKLEETSTKKQGVEIRSRFQPLDRVGCYIPGGKAIYPSSVLMNVIPAKVAGVKHIALCSPPFGGHKELNPLVLVAADLCEVDEIYRIGGVQVIAALALGTETIPAVEKIVGPGNIYVTTAKQLVSNRVAIDMPAGPSELLIIADETANPDHVCRDLISQAEHGPDSVCGLLTTSKKLAEAVAAKIEATLPSLERNQLIKQSLSRNGFILRANSLKVSISFANAFAAEHLQIMAAHANFIANQITSAGLILIGAYSPVAASDYILGSNHVLPTGGAARTHSGLSTLDFVKRITSVACSKETLQRYMAPVRTLALAEGLPNHYLAVAERFSLQRGTQ